MHVVERSVRAAESHGHAAEVVLDWLRSGAIGPGAPMESPYGLQRKAYFDFTASGLPFGPLEDLVRDAVLPYYGNTHSEAAGCPRITSRYVDRARAMIKASVNASDGYDALFTGSGSTAAINHMIYMLGLRVPQRALRALGGPCGIPAKERPVIFLSRMEHHSNDIAWRETIGDVAFVGYDERGRISPSDLAEQVARPEWAARPKIGTFSAASNVTGIVNDTAALAQVMHEHDGLAFFDYAACAPYVDIDMQPSAEGAHMDAVFVSVHKFFGGPQAPGLLIVRDELVDTVRPVQPGGGTVLYTSPWEWQYLEESEVREQGGTPPIVGVIRTALAFQLKSYISKPEVMAAEHRHCRRILERWQGNPRIRILGVPSAEEFERGERIGIFSVIFDDDRMHHHLVVSMLSDRFGIQARSGCMCAGTYGHDLLGIARSESTEIRDELDRGHVCAKPGWVRFSVTPVTTDDEVDRLLGGVDETMANFDEWRKDYVRDESTGEWRHGASAPSSPSLELEPPPPST